MQKVLIIEDDSVVSLSLKVQLEQKGYEVLQVFNGAAVIRKVINFNPDVILLDIGLPDKSGYEICKELREFYCGGIIFITGHETAEAEITSLGLGADDFVAKSSPFEVLYLRMARLGFRPRVNQQQQFNVNGIEFKASVADCMYNELPIGLTQEEFELFYFIAVNRGEVVSRQRILKVLKGAEYNGIDRSIDIKVARIRAKLKQAGLSKNMIQSIRSKGYQLVVSAPTLN